MTQAGSNDAAPAAKPPRGVKWKRAVRWSISILAVVFVVWMIPIRDRCTPAGCEDGVITTFKRANLPLLVVLFAIYLGGTVAWAARWRALLQVAGVRLTLRAAWRVTIEAQAGGILLPGGVAGDALRLAYVKERAPDADLAKVGASIVTDRVVGLITLTTLALALALLFDESGELRVAVPVLAGVPVAVALGWLVLRHPGLQRMRFLETKLGQRFVKPLLEYASSPAGPRALALGLLLSLLVSGCQLFVVRGLVAALAAVPREGAEAWLHVGAAFAMTVAALPISPGGWGTSEAAYVLFLGHAGIAAPAATAVCLLYRLMWYLTGSMGAVSAFARTDRE